MTRCLQTILAAALLTLTAIHASSPAWATATRPYTFDEMLQMQSVAPGRFSADGRFLTVWTTRVEMFPDPVSRSQSRIYDVQAGELYDITLPAVRGLTFGPWSPSGHRLIIYRYTKPSDDEGVSPEIALGVWDAALRTYRELPKPAHSDGYARAEDAQWVGDGAILLVLRRGGDRIEESEARLREWRKARVGEEPTASALDSGPAILRAGEPTDRLVQVKLATGEATTLDEGVILSFHPAPDGRSVAVLKAGAAIAPAADKPIDTESFWDSLTLIDLTGTRAPVRMSRDLDVYHHHYLTDFFSWSPDSRRLSFYGHDVDQSISASRLHVYDVPSARYRAVRTGALKLVVPVFNSGFAVAPVHWLRGAPVVLTPGALPRGADTSNPGPTGCWQLTVNEDPVRLATGSTETPLQLLQEGETLLAISGGALWRLHGSGGSTRIYSGETHALTGFAVTALNPRDARSVQVQLRKGDRIVDAYIDLKTSALTEAASAPAGARLEAHTAAVPDRRLYRKEDLTGTYLILANGPDSPSKQIFAANTQLQEIKLSGRRSITYTLPGRAEPLSAWVFTPPDYQPGQRYPVIVQVYAGVTLAPEPNLHYIGTNPQEPFPLITPDLYTAAGYVVMMPTAPLDKDAKPFDMPQQITAAVNAALDKLIAEGIADADRLAIMGHSFMAANTLAILTQSTRFKAAVAWAGVYDLGSWYGTYYLADVMDPLIHHKAVSRAFLLENGLARLGVAPWQDPDTYIRNSPLYLAGRITTPLLFLHGDADTATPISQSEEMFTALVRQGKTARFVRYWGDDHMLGLANARHAFDEIMQWLQVHLK